MHLNNSVSVTSLNCQPLYAYAYSVPDNSTDQSTSLLESYTTMGFFDKAKEAVGLNPSREEILQEEVPEESIFGSVCPKLTFQQVRVGVTV